MIKEPKVHAHPNSRYPAGAIAPFPEAERPPLFAHPNRHYPQVAFLDMNAPQNTPRNMPKMNPVFLKSALKGRGLPSQATQPRQSSPFPGRYQNADPLQYRINQLNSLKKEAHKTMSVLLEHTTKYNELIDLIKLAKKQLDNDTMLLSLQKPKEQPILTENPAVKPQIHAVNRNNDMLLRKITERARNVSQSTHHNEANDAKLSDVVSKIVEKDEVDIEEEESVDMESVIQTPPLNFMSITMQYKIALWLRDHDSLTFEQYNELDAMYPHPSVEEITDYYHNQQRVLRDEPLADGVKWMRKLKQTLWKDLRPDPIVPITKPGANAHNDSLLDRVSAEAAKGATTEEEEEDEKTANGKQLYFPPLEAINFMEQYKIAMWLKDHDELTKQQYEEIDRTIPMPTLEQITQYYENQQKVLRREPLDKCCAWMKKLRKTLWKGLKPDPIPSNEQN